MASDPSAIESIYTAALNLPSADERKEYVARKCGEDMELLREVEELLLAHEKAGSFLNRPAMEVEATIGFSPSDANRAAALDAGLTGAFDREQLLVLGNSGHSILKTLGQILGVVPRVTLRGAEAGEVADPRMEATSPAASSRAMDSRYQVHGEIARGGMGAILKGRDTDLGRDLAIKVLLDSHKDKPDVVQRFIEEAQIGGQLQHPGIAPVYELGQFADHRPFFSMKLVKGETLAKLLAGRASPDVERGRFLGIFEQVCQTMAYAHSRGVIHRDLKPANIMVGAFGEVQVMDWGLAKVLQKSGDQRRYDPQTEGSFIQTLRNREANDTQIEGDSSVRAGTHTQLGSVMGTPAYMPPEQALGEVDSLDERADVFGLGAILCEVLTGKPPYVGDSTMAVFRLASRGTLDDCFARLDRCGADAELIEIAKQCLALSPSDRPRDAGALAGRITTYVQSVETRLRAAEVDRAAEAARAEQALHTVAATEARARAERHTKRWQLTLAAVVLLLVSIGGLAAAWSAVLQRQLKDLAIDAGNQANQARAQAVLAARREQAMSLEAQSLQQKETELRLQAERREVAMQALLYAAEMNLAGQAAQDVSGLRRVAEFASHWTPDRASRDLRGWEWRFLDTLPRLDRRTIEANLVNTLDWRSDGSQFATGHRDGRIQVWDAASGRLVSEFTGGNDSLFRVAWSPDGTRLASAGMDECVRIWDPVARMVCAPVQKFAEDVVYVSWNPNGQELAVKCGSNVTISNVETGKTLRSFEVEGREGSVEWHPTKPLLAAPLAIFDLSTGAKIASPPGYYGKWSPDGAKLATVSFRNAYILSGEDGKVLWELTGHLNDVASIAWSPTGTEVATASRDDTVRIWDAASGKLKEVIRGHNDWVLGVGWNPQGQQLVSMSQSAIKQWDWPLRGNPAVLPADHKDCEELVWGRDGSLAVMKSRHVEFWNPATMTKSSEVDLGMGDVTPGSTPSRCWNSTAKLLAFHRDRGIVLLEDSTGELRRKIPDRDAEIRSLALNPDATRIAIASFMRTNRGEHSVVRLYDTATGDELWSHLHDGNVGGCLAWSPDGSRLAVGGWVTILILDARTGALIAKNDSDHSRGWVREIAWNPAGDQIAAAHFNHSLGIFDAKQGHEVQKLVGHTSEVIRVAWHPDGSRIASGGRDQTVRIWEPSRGLQLIVLKGHQATVSAMQWSRDGNTLATGSADGEVRLWDSTIDPARQQLVAPNATPKASTVESAPNRLADLPLTAAEIERELSRLADELKGEPESVVRLNNRGVFLARLGRWRESAQDYRTITKLEPARRYHWGIAATPLLMAGDQEAFREHCQEMVQQFQGPVEADVADTVCKTALLIPDAVKLADLPIETIRAGADDPRWAPYQSWFLACCALTSYREGQPEAAMEWIGKMPHLDGHSGAMALCVRAMAEFKLGKVDAARESLQVAEQRIPQPLRTLGTAEYAGPLPVPSGVADHDWLVAEILRREAAALLK